MSDEPNFHATSYWQALFSSFTEFDDHIETSWFLRLRYGVLRNSIFWTLLIVFLAGTVEANILNMGYLIFSVVFLYSANRIYKHRNRLWRYARGYNIAVIIAKVQ